MPAASPRSVPCWVLEWVAGGSSVVLPPAWPTGRALIPAWSSWR
ncbi:MULTISPECIES: hypothetical protein [Micromonospora]|nr:hypothetical protein [Micromonospora sp. CNB394]